MHTGRFSRVSQSLFVAYVCSIVREQTVTNIENAASSREQNLQDEAD